jgi:uncharacterized membrane protein YedE/YeeE
VAHLAPRPLISCDSASESAIAESEFEMTIDWVHFTPWSSLAGGMIIGAAAGLLMLGAGKIMGASAILGGAIAHRAADRGWRIGVLAGILLAPSVFALFSRGGAPVFTTPWPLLVVSGLLVGFGTRLGSGCTSGHGICGLSRLSPRSAVATGIFLVTAIATVFAVRHIAQ